MPARRSATPRIFPLSNNGPMTKSGSWPNGSYRPNTGKLLLPGSQIRWDIHMHAVGDAIRDHVELGVYLYPKGEVPKYRTRLTILGSVPGNLLDIPPNSVTQTQNFHVLKDPAR